VELSLEEWDASGQDSHEIQFSEIPNVFPSIAQISELHDGLRGQCSIRGGTPTGMLGACQGMEVSVERKGDGAHVLHVSRD
jgi:hypothetical protein